MNQDTQWYDEDHPREQSPSFDDDMNEPRQEELQRRLDPQLDPNFRNRQYHDVPVAGPSGMQHQRSRSDEFWGYPYWDPRGYQPVAGRMEEQYYIRRSSFPNFGWSSGSDYFRSPMTPPVSFSSMSQSSLELPPEYDPTRPPPPIPPAAMMYERHYFPYHSQPPQPPLPIGPPPSSPTRMAPLPPSPSRMAPLPPSPSRMAPPPSSPSRMAQPPSSPSRPHPSSLMAPPPPPPSRTAPRPVPRTSSAQPTAPSPPKSMSESGTTPQEPHQPVPETPRVQELQQQIIEIVDSPPSHHQAGVITKSNLKAGTVVDLTDDEDDLMVVGSYIQPESSSPQQPGPSSSQRSHSHSPQQPGPSSSQRSHSHSPQQPGPSSSQRSHSHSPQQPGPSSSQRSHSHSPQQPGPSSSQRSHSHSPQQPGPSSSQRSHSHSPQQPGPSSSQRSHSHSPQQPGPSSSQRSHSHSPQQPGPSSSQRSHSHSPQQPGPSSSQRSHSHSPQQPGPSSSQRSHSHSPQQPGPSSSERSVSHSPQQSGSSGSQQSDSHSPQEPGLSGSLQDWSAGYQQYSLQLPQNMWDDMLLFMGEGADVRPLPIFERQGNPYPSLPQLEYMQAHSQFNIFGFPYRHMNPIYNSMIQLCPDVEGTPERPSNQSNNARRDIVYRFFEDLKTTLGDNLIDPWMFCQNRTDFISGLNYLIEELQTNINCFPLPPTDSIRSGRVHFINYLNKVLVAVIDNMPRIGFEGAELTTYLNSMAKVMILYLQLCAAFFTEESQRRKNLNPLGISYSCIVVLSRCLLHRLDYITYCIIEARPEYEAEYTTIFWTVINTYVLCTVRYSRENRLDVFRLYVLYELFMYGCKRYRDIFRIRFNNVYGTRAKLRRRNPLVAIIARILNDNSSYAGIYLGLEYANWWENKVCKSPGTSAIIGACGVPCQTTPENSQSSPDNIRKEDEQYISFYERLYGNDYYGIQQTLWDMYASDRGINLMSARFRTAGDRELARILTSDTSNLDERDQPGPSGLCRGPSRPQERRQSSSSSSDSMGRMADNESEPPVGIDFEEPKTKDKRLARKRPSTDATTALRTDEIDSDRMRVPTAATEVVESHQTQSIAEQQPTQVESVPEIGAGQSSNVDSDTLRKSDETSPEASSVISAPKRPSRDVPENSSRLVEEFSEISITDILGQDDSDEEVELVEEQTTEDTKNAEVDETELDQEYAVASYEVELSENPSTSTEVPVEIETHGGHSFEAAEPTTTSTTNVETTEDVEMTTEDKPFEKEDVQHSIVLPSSTDTSTSKKMSEATPDQTKRSTSIEVSVEIINQEGKSGSSTQSTETSISPLKLEATSGGEERSTVIEANQETASSETTQSMNTSTSLLKLEATCDDIDQSTTSEMPAVMNIQQSERSETVQLMKTSTFPMVSEATSDEKEPSITSEMLAEMDTQEPVRSESSQSTATEMSVEIEAENSETSQSTATEMSVEIEAQEADNSETRPSTVTEMYVEFEAGNSETSRSTATEMSVEIEAQEADNSETRPSTATEMSVEIETQEPDSSETRPATATEMSVEIETQEPDSSETRPATATEMSVKIEADNSETSQFTTTEMFVEIETQDIGSSETTQPTESTTPPIKLEATNDVVEQTTIIKLQVDTQELVSSETIHPMNTLTASTDLKPSNDVEIVPVETGVHEIESSDSIQKASVMELERVGDVVEQPINIAMPVESVEATSNIEKHIAPMKVSGDSTSSEDMAGTSDVEKSPFIIESADACDVGDYTSLIGMPSTSPKEMEGTTDGNESVESEASNTVEKIVRQFIIYGEVPPVPCEGSISSIGIPSTSPKQLEGNNDTERSTETSISPVGSEATREIDQSTEMEIQQNQSVEVLRQLAEAQGIELRRQRLELRLHSANMVDVMNQQVLASNAQANEQVTVDQSAEETVEKDISPRTIQASLDYMRELAEAQGIELRQQSANLVKTDQHKLEERRDIENVTEDKPSEDEQDEASSSSKISSSAASDAELLLSSNNTTTTDLFSGPTLSSSSSGFKEESPQESDKLEQIEEASAQLAVAVEEPANDEGPKTAETIESRADLSSDQAASLLEAGDSTQQRESDATESVEPSVEPKGPGKRGKLALSGNSSLEPTPHHTPQRKPARKKKKISEASLQNEEETLTLTTRSVVLATMVAGQRRVRKRGKVITKTTSSLEEPIASTSAQLEKPIASTSVQLEEPIASTSAQLEEPIASTSMQLEVRIASREPIASTHTQSEESIASTHTQSEGSIASSSTQCIEPTTSTSRKRRSDTRSEKKKKENESEKSSEKRKKTESAAKKNVEKDNCMTKVLQRTDGQSLCNEISVRQSCELFEEVTEIVVQPEELKNEKDQLNQTYVKVGTGCDDFSIHSKNSTEDERADTSDSSLSLAPLPYEKLNKKKVQKYFNRKRRQFDATGSCSSEADSSTWSSLTASTSSLKTSSYLSSSASSLSSDSFDRSIKSRDPRLSGQSEVAKRFRQSCEMKLAESVAHEWRESFDDSTVIYNEKYSSEKLAEVEQQTNSQASPKPSATSCLDFYNSFGREVSIDVVDEAGVSEIGLINLASPYTEDETITINVRHILNNLKQEPVDEEPKQVVAEGTVFLTPEWDYDQANPMGYGNFNMPVTAASTAQPLAKNPHLIENLIAIRPEAVPPLQQQPAVIFKHVDNLPVNVVQKTIPEAEPLPNSTHAVSFFEKRVEEIYAKEFGQQESALSSRTNTRKYSWRDAAVSSLGPYHRPKTPAPPKSKVLHVTAEDNEIYQSAFDEPVAKPNRGYENEFSKLLWPSRGTEPLNGQVVATVKTQAAPVADATTKEHLVSILKKSKSRGDNKRKRIQFESPTTVQTPLVDPHLNKLVIKLQRCDVPESLIQDYKRQKEREHQLQLKRLRYQREMVAAHERAVLRAYEMEAKERQLSQKSGAVCCLFDVTRKKQRFYEGNNDVRRNGNHRLGDRLPQKRKLDDRPTVTQPKRARVRFQ